MWSLTRLYDICSRHHFEAQGVVIPEPYIPHFPPVAVGGEWNGVLVLGEAQNLAGPTEYTAKLIRAHQSGRHEDLYNRLNLSYMDFPHELRPPPCGLVQWDVAGLWADGVTPFAVAALAELGGDRAAEVLGTSYGLEAIKRTALSNGVPWSRVGARGDNINPKPEDKRRAVCFWKELLPEIQRVSSLGEPIAICAFGNKSQEVMLKAGYPPRLCTWLPVAMNRPGFKKEAEPFLRGEPELARKLDCLMERVGHCLGIGKGDKEFARNVAAVVIKRWKETE